jgi:hypothetical protein
MKTLCSHLLAALFFVSLGASSSRAEKENTIDGRIFIVTKDSGNLKPEMVQVSIFPEEIFTKFTADKRKLADPLKASMERISASAAAAYEKAKAAVKKDASLASELKDAELAANAARAHLLFLDSATFVFSAMPAAAAQATTDAEGNFSFEVPVGRYVVAAKYARPVGEEEEPYFWLVKLVLDAGKPMKLMLTNANLSSAPDADPAIKTLPANEERLVASAMKDEDLDSVQLFVGDNIGKAGTDELEQAKLRPANHALAVAKLKADWKMAPTARFSTLADHDDQFTVCHQLPSGQWESRGMVAPAQGQPPVPWRMIYQRRGEAIQVSYSQFGKQQVGSVPK